MKLRGLFLFLGVVFLLSVLSFNPVLAADDKNTEDSKAVSNQMIVKISVDSKKQVETLANMGLDIAEVKKDYVVVLINSVNLKKLEKRGFHFTIIEQDANAKLARFRAGTLGKYHSFEQVEKIMKDAEAAYPEICKLHVIGKSFEGRPIYALQVTSNPGANAKKPSCLIMGLHHSREWISVEVPLALIEEMTTKYAKDDKIKKLVDGRSTWIVPVTSPDGLVFSQTKSKMWRKNRRLNTDKSYGVDPNRNYGYEWGNVGASSSTGSDTYHGTGPFSEPCTSAIKQLAEQQHFIGSISFHSYSELVLYPFGYAYEATAKDDKLLAQVAGEMGKLNGYTAEKSSDLYPAMGDSDDWMYGAMGALAFTIELGSQFVPGDSEVPAICSNNVKACLHLIDTIGTTHASTHPDFASPTMVATSRYLFAAGASKGKDASAKTALVNLLNPVNDANGKNLEEFIAETAKSDAKSKQLLVPVLKEVKNMYMNNIINKIGNTRQVIRDVEKIQSELMNAENAE